MYELLDVISDYKNYNNAQIVSFMTHSTISQEASQISGMSTSRST